MEQRTDVVSGRYFVSTLRMLFEHADVLYETAVFDWDAARGAVSSEEPLRVERWSDPQEAARGHLRVCEELGSGAAPQTSGRSDV